MKFIKQAKTSARWADWNNANGVSRPTQVFVIQEQASWVCQCDDSVVQHLEQDFKKTLQQQNSLEQWAVWLEGVVNQVLKQHEGSANFPKAARQFLLKWSFYRCVLVL